jgi:glycosyltransferase involved in cell wall biosynthesis
VTSHSDWKIKLFTYSKESCTFERELSESNIELVYLYSKLQFLWKFRICQMIFSFILPFLFKKEASSCAILKSNQLWGAWVPGLTAKLVGNKFLLRCGYESFKSAQQSKSALYITYIHKFLNSLSYRLADRIHVASGEDMTFILEQFSNMYESKIHIYRNWVDTSVFKPQPINKNGKILFIGRFAPPKNLHNLILAVQNLDLHLDLIGGGELEQELKNLVEKDNSKIQFLGRVSNDKLSQIIPKYSLYVLVSFHEGTPKTLIEAMSCGSICLGTNAPGIRSIIEHKVDGWLCETDSNSIKKAIKKLFSYPNKEQLGKMARRKILEQFDLKTLIKKELDAYHVLSN